MVAINLQDSEKLKAFYEQLPHEGLTLSRDEFVGRVANNDCWRFSMKDWFGYIEDETHYHLERQGWEWLDSFISRGRFVKGIFIKNGQDLTPEEYQRERDRVLKAFVYQAIPFFQNPKLFENSHFISSLERDIANTQ